MNRGQWLRSRRGSKQEEGIDRKDDSQNDEERSKVAANEAPSPVRC